MAGKTSESRKEDEHERSGCFRTRPLPKDPLATHGNVPGGVYSSKSHAEDMSGSSLTHTHTTGHDLIKIVLSRAEAEISIFFTCVSTFIDLECRPISAPQPRPSSAPPPPPPTQV